MKGRNALREELAQRFLASLQEGVLPWHACWRQARPMNAATCKPYRGINAVWLSYMAQERGYADLRWCTYLQAQERDWQVRRGEKGCRVEYWAYYDTKQQKLLPWKKAKALLRADPDYERNLQLRSRVYSVFNAEQMDGIPPMEQRNPDIGAIRQQRDTLLRNMGVGYREEGCRAYYSSGTDTVTLPPEASFDDAYGYMSTFLHECGHATGHPTRLNRDLSGLRFGTPAYAMEELRAEIAAAFTAQAIGLQLTDAQLRRHMDNHIAYIRSWAAAVQDAPEELFRAIKAAEGISDYLLEKGEFEQVMERFTPEAEPQMSEFELEM